LDVVEDALDLALHSIPDKTPEPDTSEGAHVAREGTTDDLLHIPVGETGPEQTGDLAASESATEADGGDVGSVTEQGETTEPAAPATTAKSIAIGTSFEQHFLPASFKSLSHLYGLRFVRGCAIRDIPLGLNFHYEHLCANGHLPHASLIRQLTQHLLSSRVRAFVEPSIGSYIMHAITLPRVAPPIFCCWVSRLCPPRLSSLTPSASVLAFT
jgi:hypothetical protein